MFPGRRLAGSLLLAPGGAEAVSDLLRGRGRAHSGHQGLELAVVGGERGLGPAGVPVQSQGVGLRALPQEGDQLLVRVAGEVHPVAAEQLVAGPEAAV